MDYKVVYGQGLSIVGAVAELEQEVDDLIMDGYKPQGGVSVTTEDSNSNWITVCQAMIKEY